MAKKKVIGTGLRAIVNGAPIEVLKVRMPDDKLRSRIEEVIKPDSLPAAVKAAVDNGLPKTRINKAERVTENGIVTYELQVKTPKERLELVVTEDGKILKKEHKGTGKGEEKD